MPFLGGLRAQYDTPSFGTTVEVLTGVGALNVLGGAGKNSPAVTPQLPSGSFSIADWVGYPTVAGVPKPSGPLRLLEGAEYAGARKAANSTNRSLHNTDPSLAGKQIHEVQPVKFGGSPTHSANKIPLTPAEHSPYTNWWNQLMRDITR